MPRSRSRSILSRYWSRMSRSATAWVSSSRRSARVDLPWSMWATMQKFRMRPGSVIEDASVTAGLSYGRRAPAARARGGPLVHSTVMANIKSQIKRNRQNAKRHDRNKAVRSSLKTSTKKVYAAVAEGDAEAASASAKDASRAFDKAASKGIVHKRTAARHKS